MNPPSPSTNCRTHGDEESEKGNVAERNQNDGDYNPERHPGDVQKDGLEGVEADVAILIVGCQHQE